MTPSLAFIQMSGCGNCGGSGRALDLPCPCTVMRQAAEPACPHCTGHGIPEIPCVGCTGSYAHRH